MARKLFLKPSVSGISPRKYSITRLYWLSFVLLVATPTLLFGYLWASDQTRNFREQSAALQQSYPRNQKPFLPREVAGQQVRRRIAYAVLIMLGVLLAATVVAERLASKTRAALRQFNELFAESNRQRTPILVDQLPLIELEQLAVEANRMLEYRLGVEQQLMAARVAAEEAGRAKSQFLSTMSHELRTPLNGVLGSAQILMRDPAITAEQQRHLGAIQCCGQHLLALINDVLDLAKVESGASGCKLTLPFEKAAQDQTCDPQTVASVERQVLALGALSAVPIKALPGSVRADLHVALAEGDLEAMHTALRQCELLGDGSAEAARHVRDLLDNFELEAVRDLLAPSIERA